MVKQYAKKKLLHYYIIKKADIKICFLYLLNYKTIIFLCV